VRTPGRAPSKSRALFGTAGDVDESLRSQPEPLDNPTYVMHHYAHYLPAPAGSRDTAMPTDAEIRSQRQALILAILRERPVGSQGELVERLGERGFAATQSSVSRDLRDLGVARVAGRYVVPPEREMRDTELREVARFLRSARPAGPHLTVVQTVVGAAQTVAVAIDAAGWDEVVGTMAGDDTIFVATAGASEQRHLLQRLEGLLEER